MAAVLKRGEVVWADLNSDVRHHSSWVTNEQTMYIRWPDNFWLDWMGDGRKGWVDDWFRG